jgi:hypothetical protein
LVHFVVVVVVVVDADADADADDVMFLFYYAVVLLFFYSVLACLLVRSFVVYVRSFAVIFVILYCSISIFVSRI